MSNCLILFDFADYYNLTDISMNAFKFILFNIADLMDDKKFLVMTTKLMTQIMLKPYLEIPSEEYIIIKFIEWVKYDLENRASEAIELLKLVKPTLVRRKVSELFLFNFQLTLFHNCYPYFSKYSLIKSY